MPNTDTQDVNQELNTSLNPNAGAAPVPQNHHYAQPSVAQAMTAPAKVPAPYPTPTAPGVPMISPDHTDTRVVPQSQQADAAQAGWEPATKMVHLTTQDKRWVPASQSADAMKSGYVHADVSAASTESHPFAGLGSAAKDLVTGLVTAGPINSAREVYNTITDDIPAEYKAYEAAKSTGASRLDAWKAAQAKAIEISDAKNQLTQAIKQFQTNPNKAAWSAVLKLGSVALGSRLAEVEPETGPGEIVQGAEESEAAPKSGITGYAKRLVSPTAATQPEAQTAFRAGAQSSAEDAGVSSVPSNQGIRTLMTKPIADASAVEKTLYKTVNDAAETDMKSLYDRREELTDALDEPTQIANKTALQKELSTTQADITTGEAKVQSALGKSAPDLISKAKAATQQRFAMEQGDAKLFNNESVVKGNAAHGTDETINVDSAISNAEKLDKPSRFAPRGTPSRLQQMFGEDGAKAFKQGLYDAQKSGKTVLTRNAFLRTARNVGLIGGGTIEGLHLLFGGK